MTSRRLVIFSALGLLASPVIVEASGFARAALSAVVATCSLHERLTGSPAPCLKLERPAGESGGYVIVREPGFNSRTILSPLEAIDGIESSRLLDPGSPNYFAMAWNERRLVLAAHPNKNDWSDAALAVNSVDGRTQDHLHIHIACVRADVRAAIDKRATTIATNEFRPFGVSLRYHRFMISHIVADSLDTIDPVKLVAREVPGAAADMASQTIVVIGTTYGGRNGFYVLSGRSQGKSDDIAAEGELLLDPACKH